MRNVLVLGLALLVGTCAACGTAPPPKPEPTLGQQVRQLEQQTVALVKPGASGPYCTGVWVAYDAFLTANHCVRRLDLGDTVTYAVRADVPADEPEGVRVGRLVLRDAEHDLAVVRDAGAPAHGVAKISEPSVGQNVHTMGHPLGLWWSYSRGEVAAIRLRDFSGTEMWWVQATAPISPGNSGGGLFDSEGNLIGIVAGVLTGGENLNLFVHPKYAKALLGVDNSQVAQ